MIIPKSDLVTAVAGFLGFLNSEGINTIKGLEEKAGVEYEKGKKSTIPFDYVNINSEKPLAIRVNVESNYILYNIECLDKIEGYEQHRIDSSGNIIQSKVSRPASVSRLKQELIRLGRFGNGYGGDGWKDRFKG